MKTHQLHIYAQIMKTLVGILLISSFEAQALKGSTDEMEAEMSRLKATSDVAAKLPPGPERDALLAVVKAGLDALSARINNQQKDMSSIVGGGYLEMIKVDQTGNWAVAEVKKPYLKDIIGESVNLKDGRVVKLDVVTAITPSGMRWIGDKLEETHWGNLPEKLVVSYGWTKARQSAYESWKSAADKKAASAVSAERLKAMQAQNESNEHAKIERSRVAVSLRVSQALPDGCLCYGTRIETSSSWSGWVGLRWVEGIPPAQEHDEPIFVVGLPSTSVDGDRLAGWLYPCGVFRYTAVSGAAKAVRRYATTAQRAKQLLSE